MNTSLKRISGIIACLALASQAQAAPGAILSPTAVIFDDVGEAGFSYQIGRMIDQSGLSSGFTSGVTDFNTYLSTSPKHTYFASGYEWFSSLPLATLPAHLIFDLGGIYTIDRMAIWNEESGGVKNIDLSLPSGPLIGSFLITDNYSYIGAGQYPAQVLSFTPVTTQFVELTMHDFWNSSGNWDGPSIGELAFRLTAIPEPGTYAALLGIGSLLGARALQLRRAKNS